MKIKLLRASNTVKEIEFAATLPPLGIAVGLMFENSKGTKRSYGRMKRTPAARVTKFKLCPTKECC
jgi:hypothetical protein